MRNCYRVMRYDDGRLITTVGREMDSFDMIANAVAEEFAADFAPRLHADEVEFVEEIDALTGESIEVACGFGVKLARVWVP